MEAPNPFEKQLEEFDAEYRHRRAELEQKAAEAGHEVESEKETVHNLVKEKIQPQITPPPSANWRSGSTPTDDANASPEVHNKVQEIVNITLAQGFDEAVKQLEKINNPAVTDAYHAAITGSLFDELVKREAIPTLK